MKNSWYVHRKAVVEETLVVRDEDVGSRRFKWASCKALITSTHKVFRDQGTRLRGCVFSTNKTALRLEC